MKKSYHSTNYKETHALKHCTQRLNRLPLEQVGAITTVDQKTQLEQWPYTYETTDYLGH